MSALDPDLLADPVLVVAPHPDDESIGCGGLIATLRRRQRDVSVVVMTDGTGSHPHSRQWPAARLAALRREEAIEALRILGVAAGHVAFWQLADRYVPEPLQDGFSDQVARAEQALCALLPATLVLPEGSDAHGDHRATWAIWRHAARGLPFHVLEYVVWPGDASPQGERRELDITEVVALKSAAISAHRSQHGLIVPDDPEGFTLPPDLLARAARNVETFYEAT